jgi:hypothetical protein
MVDKVRSSDIRRVVKEEIAEEVLEFWLLKNEGYGEQLFDFDVRAQAMEINRKNGKIKRALWDGEGLVAGESLEEVLFDMIGHCYITIARLRLEGNPHDQSTERHPKTLMQLARDGDFPCPCGSSTPAVWCLCDS